MDQQVQKPTDAAPMPSTADFQLRFEGSVAEQHLIPAEILAASIESLQKIVYILAMDHEDRAVAKRVRVTGRMAHRYTVLCHTAREGSYAQPFQIGSQKPDLLSVEDVQTVRSRFVQSVDFLSGQQTEQFLSHVSDPKLSKRLVSAFRTLIPKVGSGVTVVLEDWSSGAAVPYRFDDRHATYLREALEQPDQQYVRQTVTGRLEKIDFGERRITIIYPATNRELHCTYDEGIEEMLLENRRELIQVTGIVTLDEHDNPTRVTAVNSISYLDLSPFEIVELPFDDYRLHFTKPLVLELALDESQQLLAIEDENLGLHVFAQTREQLWEELHEQFEMLWLEYANEDDETLSSEARALKWRLVNRIQEIPISGVARAA